MSLSAGMRLGPYEILEPVGAGGMGEVYRARDTRLDRTVAIKTLPEPLSSSPELHQRFEREARAVSSLSHPHICALYDIGNHEGVDYLVMEFLEGETLSDRLRKGPLPIDEILQRATEIADALDKAHQLGLVHRDLKPGNIMLTKSGAKLLDFGLAKSMPSTDEATSATAAPTVTSPLTTKGTIVGTYQYMSPEQLEGRDVDARSDIFAFGAVLYEMASGQKAFEGKSQAGVFAAILEREPPSITATQPNMPPALDRLIKTCLAKDPNDRRQTMHDVALDLKWIGEGGSRVGVPVKVSSRRRSRERFAWIVAAALFLAAIALGYAYYSAVHKEVRVVRSTVPAPGNAEFFVVSNIPGPVKVSPDGRTLVFAAKEEGGQPHLWVRELDSDDARPLPGTEGATYPFWSPDSRTIGFFADEKLKKIDASGGPVLTLCTAENGKGGTWNRDGVILFAPLHNSAIHRVPAAGGESTPVTAVDTLSEQLSHRHPHFLPDGNTFLYLARSYAPEEPDAIMIGSLEEDEARLLRRGESNVAYASGHLLYMQEGALMGQPFDPDRCEFIGDAFPVAQEVRYLSGARAGVFSASQNGVLAYLSGAGEEAYELVWYNRTGEIIGILGGRADYSQPRISPDGEHVAVLLTDPVLSTTDIWILDVSSGIRTRFTFDRADEETVLWSPDGSRIIFSSSRNGQHDLYVKSFTGTESEELLLESENDKFASSWSEDGRYILYDEDGDIWALPLFGDRKPFTVLNTEHDEEFGKFSPDGRWIAYQTDIAGHSEIYVTPFPEAGRKWQVSAGGGFMPWWAPEANAITYVGNDMFLKIVEVDAHGSSFRVGKSSSLFDVTGAMGGSGTRDAERILIATAVEDSPRMLNLVINWDVGLEGN